MIRTPVAKHASIQAYSSIFAALVCLLGVLSGCAGSRGGPIPYDVKDFGRPDSPEALTLSEDYKIAPMDTLRVAVFQVPDLSGDFEVDLTGHIALPLVGNVKAVDMTIAQLDDYLTRQLEAKYLQNPDVIVGIKSSTRRSVTVDGAVRQPGVFPVTGDLSLMQAVALARGTEEDANPRRVAVFRQIGGKRQAAAFDLLSIRRGEMVDPKIYVGDIIVVDGSNLKRVQRELLQAIPVLAIFNPF